MKTDRKLLEETVHELRNALVPLALRAKREGREADEGVRRGLAMADEIARHLTTSKTTCPGCGSEHKDQDRAPRPPCARRA